VNELLVAATAVSEGENANEALVQRQADYTKAVEAHLRVAGRHGLRKKPTSAVEVRLLQLEELCRQTCLFEGMLDSYRAVVRRRFLLAIHALY